MLCAVCSSILFVFFSFISAFLHCFALSQVARSVGRVHLWCIVVAVGEINEYIRRRKNNIFSWPCVPLRRKYFAECFQNGRSIHFQYVQFVMNTVFSYVYGAHTQRKHKHTLSLGWAMCCIVYAFAKVPSLTHKARSRTRSLAPKPGPTKYNTFHLVSFARSNPKRIHSHKHIYMMKKRYVYMRAIFARLYLARTQTKFSLKHSVNGSSDERGTQNEKTTYIIIRRNDRSENTCKNTREREKNTYIHLEANEFQCIATFVRCVETFSSTLRPLRNEEQRGKKYEKLCSASSFF